MSRQSHYSFREKHIQMSWDIVFFSALKKMKITTLRLLTYPIRLPVLNSSKKVFCEITKTLTFDLWPNSNRFMLTCAIVWNIDVRCFIRPSIVFPLPYTATLLSDWLRKSFVSQREEDGIMVWDEKLVQYFHSLTFWDWENVSPLPTNQSKVSVCMPLCRWQSQPEALCFQVVHLSLLFSWTRYFRNALRMKPCLCWRLKSNIRSLLVLFLVSASSLGGNVWLFSS